MNEHQLERFEAKVLCSGFDECWYWIASADTSGYGHIRLDGKLVKAHRASYEHFVGPIGEGLQLDHLCRKPACVNPKHLEPVTERENVLRGVGPGALNARKTHCLRGHEYTPENTYAQTRANKAGVKGRQCRQCKLKVS
jgi:hypothetical protein